ncbi:MAG: TIR domain-containing protein [Methanocellales archaeon]|nr:TIR domain-containing protein [Methanocellales archaeon]MDD4898036.1 TIR domain-containing protein [Methanocellales archaeon]
MKKEEALYLLRNGKSSEWNSYRERNRDWRPDLSNESLEDVVLYLFNLSKSNLCGSKLPPKRGNYIRDKYPYESNTSYPPNNKVVNLSDTKFDKNTNFPAGINLCKYGAFYVSESESSVDTYNKMNVFIGYAWANEDVILAIEQWLRNKGLSTRIDRRDFFAGERIRNEIMRVMSECNVILIFYSKDAKDKPWPQFEREMAGDLEMDAKKRKVPPPRIIYVVIDDTPLPSISEENRIAVMAKGKRFELVCEEIHHNILQLPRPPEKIDLSKWSKYEF